MTRLGSVVRGLVWPSEVWRGMARLGLEVWGKDGAGAG